MHSECDRGSGFSLLEVLVAFVILSAALVAANQSISYSLRSFSSAQMARAADRVAEEIYSERLSSPGAPSGETGLTPNGLKWRLNREPFSLGMGNSDVTAEKLTLEVTAQSDGRIVRRYVFYHSIQSSEVDHAP